MTQTPPPPPLPGQDPTRQAPPHQGYAQPQPGQPYPHQGYAQPGYAQPAYGGGRASSEEKSMMLLAHLSAPISMLVTGGWLNFVGPLIIWLLYKDRSAAVREVAAGAFNYNVATTLISWAVWISVFLTFGIGLLWAIPIWIAMVVPHIIGVLRANRGEVYRYPFQLRLLS